jgi:hypothetical protein
LHVPPDDGPAWLKHIGGIPMLQLFLQNIPWSLLNNVAFGKGVHSKLEYTSSLDMNTLSKFSDLKLNSNRIDTRSELVCHVEQIVNTAVTLKATLFFL